MHRHPVRDCPHRGPSLTSDHTKRSLPGPPPLVLPPSRASRVGPGREKETGEALPPPRQTDPSIQSPSHVPAVTRRGRYPTRIRLSAQGACVFSRRAGLRSIDDKLTWDRTTESDSLATRTAIRGRRPNNEASSTRQRGIGPRNAPDVLEQHISNSRFYFQSLQ